MVLERFDAIVFIGDDMLKAIYSAFNMLLRENIVTGGLKQWEMSETEKEVCRCDNQIMKPECATRMIMNNEEVREGGEGSGHRNHYYCDRVFLIFSTALKGRPAHRYRHAAYVSADIRFACTR